MAQDYDKIIKENLSKSIPALVKTILGFEIKKTAPLKIKLQYTVEREPDFLKKVLTGKSEEDYALQVEFHSGKETRDMLYRTMGYKAFILRQHRLKVKQFVFYIGNEKPKMETEYKDEDTFHRFHLIDFKTIDYEHFIKSEKAEEVVFAILADFKNKNPNVVIENIAKRLIELVEGQLGLEKYRRQLEILSKLRNLQTETIKILNAMPIVYDLKTDIRFLQGKAEGLEKGKLLKAKIFVTKLLFETDFPIKKIANLADVDIKFVKKIKKELEERQKNQPSEKPSGKGK